MYLTENQKIASAYRKMYESEQSNEEILQLFKDAEKRMPFGLWFDLGEERGGVQISYNPETNEMVWWNGGCTPGAESHPDGYLEYDKYLSLDENLGRAYEKIEYFEYLNGGEDLDNIEKHDADTSESCSKRKRFGRKRKMNESEESEEDLREQYKDILDKVERICKKHNARTKNVYTDADGNLGIIFAVDDPDKTLGVGFNMNAIMGAGYGIERDMKKAGIYASVGPGYVGNTSKITVFTDLIDGGRSDE